MRFSGLGSIGFFCRLCLCFSDRLRRFFSDRLCLCFFGRSRSESLSLLFLEFVKVGSPFFFGFLLFLPDFLFYYTPLLGLDEFPERRLAHTLIFLRR